MKKKNPQKLSKSKVAKNSEIKLTCTKTSTSKITPKKEKTPKISNNKPRNEIPIINPPMNKQKKSKTTKVKKINTRTKAENPKYRNIIEKNKQNNQEIQQMLNNHTTDIFNVLAKTKNTSNLFTFDNFPVNNNTLSIGSKINLSSALTRKGNEISVYPENSTVPLFKTKSIYNIIIPQNLSKPYSCECLTYYRKPIQARSECLPTPIDKNSFYVFVLPVDPDMISLFYDGLDEEYNFRKQRKILYTSKETFMKTLFKEYVLWFSLITNIPLRDPISYLLKKENFFAYQNYVYKMILDPTATNTKLVKDQYINPFIKMWFQTQKLYTCNTWKLNVLTIPDLQYYSGWLQDFTNICESVFSYEKVISNRDKK